MSRIIRIAEMYHQNDYDVSIDLIETVAADILVIPVTHGIVAKTTGADAEACTLANGKPGQILVVYIAASGGGAGLATITPATLTGFATVALLGASDTVIFLYVDDIIGWIILSAFGTDQPPVIA